MCNTRQTELCGHLTEASARELFMACKPLGKLFCGICAVIAVIALLVPVWRKMCIPVILVLLPLGILLCLCDDDPTYLLNQSGAVINSKRKKYVHNFSWDEIVDVCEILVKIPQIRTQITTTYIAMMRKTHTELNINIANCREYAAEDFGYILSHPDIIAVPRTEEAVRFIEQFKTIKPLPEKYKKTD